MATPLAIAAAQAAALQLGYTVTSGTVATIDVVVGTLNGAGAPADLGLFAMVAMPDADSGSPVPPFDRAALPQDTRCTSVGETTRCVFVPLSR